MRGGTALILLGVTAIMAYSVGRQNMPANNAPVAIAASSLAKPLPFGDAPAPAPTPNNSSSPSAKADLLDKPSWPDTKHETKVALTAAAIAAIIVQESQSAN
jgi:hypothetical protein